MCSFLCKDAPNKIKGKGSNKFSGSKDCECFSKSSTRDRCDYKGVKGTCRATYDYYYVTNTPTAAPLTDSPTTVTTSVIPSVTPNIAITDPPTSGPDFECVDSILKFDTDGNDPGKSFKDFKWVGKGNTKNKCEEEGVPEHYPLTCDDTTGSCAVFFM